MNNTRCTTRQKIAIAYCLMGVVSYVLIVGWVNADKQAFWSMNASSYKANNDLDRLQYERRGARLFAVSWGVIASMMWPVFLPFVYCDTSGAYYGWSLSVPEKEAHS